MSANIFYITYDLITIITGILILNDIKPTRRDIMKRTAEILLFSAAAIAVFYVFMHIFNLNGWKSHYVSRITVVLILSIYALFFSKLRVYTKVTAICVLYSASFHIESIRIVILNMLTFTDIPLTISKLIFVVFYAIIIALTGIYLKHFRVDNAKSAPNLFWIIVILVTLVSEFCSTALSVSLDIAGNNGITWGKLILGMVFLGFNMLTYYLFYTLTTSYVNSKEMALLRQKQLEATAELERAGRIYNEMRVLRHEHNNNALTMKIMLENQQYDKLKKLLDKSTQPVNADMDVIDCGNTVLNSVLNFKQNDLRSRGIDFKTSVIVPNELPFEEADLVSLLINLIDNAAEASFSTNSPSVFVQIKLERSYCFITVINPVADDILGNNPELNTTKKDKSGHGIGLKVVKSIVNKYNGHIKFEQENGNFIASLMLSLN